MKRLLILLLFGVCLQSQAQLPDYYVYLVTGDASITNPGKKPVALKQKQLVYKNDILLLKKGAELTLVDKNASYFVINTVGTSKAIEMVNKVTAKPVDGVTTKYLKLLFHELLDPNQDFEKLKKENIAGVWGGVSRSDECENRIYPVNGLQTAVASITFRWQKTSPSSNYLLVIYDQQGNEISAMKLTDTVRLVNSAETLKGKTGKYFWRVTSEDGICEAEVPIYFILLTAEDEKKLADQLTEGITGETLEARLQQIDKLEKNALIDAAAARYVNVIKANPDNKALLKSYVLFLLRYGFAEEARTVWTHNP